MTSLSVKISTFTLRLGAVFALVGVALGAFGAHGLKEILIEHETLTTWKTAVAYQMWHALALILVATMGGRKWSACAFAAGILLFSGSLYALALGGPAWLGPVTPLGGLCFMAGWVFVILGK